MTFSPMIPTLSPDFENHLSWEILREGVEISWLHKGGADAPSAAFLRYAPGATVPRHNHPAPEYVFVLRGSQADAAGLHGVGTLTINDTGYRHDLVSEEGCLLVIFWTRPVVFEALG